VETSSARVESADVPIAADEVPGVSTNSTSQSSLNAIELLELVGKYLPCQKDGNASRSCRPLTRHLASVLHQPRNRGPKRGASLISH
jgi:hypothetical protein